ncbi:3-ketoacyl-CoA synthase 6 [Senna tora]|uniref:3-ketoacyl-CoA synthase n=1 Tax=Senna tora TaxID=362788 RepID=A0A834TSU2_9FABA|nr:3-ketoacyl-CoA synthase 6 [Senna tora]
MPPIISTNSLKLGYQYLFNHNFLTLTLTLTILFLIIFISTLYYLASTPRAVFLVDFACSSPPAACRVPSAAFREIVAPNDVVDFQMKILQHSGLGEETYLPPAFHAKSNPPDKPTLQASRAEAEIVIFSAVDSLLEKTGLEPKDIDILIVNCSLFSPTPSLSAMVINKYKLRSNIKSFNLSGMGCSAGLISVDLARDLLQVHGNSNAVVVSTEIITPNQYKGNVKGMVIANCFFRMGGAAMLLSNRWSERGRAKYRLVHVVRTHKAADDKAYRCLFQEQDDEGKVGLLISRDLVDKAGEALKSNITTLGPLVLPLSEKLLIFFTLILTKFFNSKRKPYIPDFKKAFHHFIIHVGGNPIIDGMQKNLQLSDENVEPPRMTLHRFGNTSSSSIWYQLEYIESKGRMKKGNKVWQLGFGSGFKCVSAIWKCNRSIDTPMDGPWADCIHRYPIKLNQEEDEGKGKDGEKVDLLLEDHKLNFASEYTFPFAGVNYYISSRLKSIGGSGTYGFI